MNANLQVINDQLMTDGEDDTFASIVVPYYKGRLESDIPEKLQPVIFSFIVYRGRDDKQLYIVIVKHCHKVTMTLSMSFRLSFAPLS